MEERVYMHTVNNRYFNSRRDIKVLSSILDSNAILSLRRQGKSHSSSFAGLDYISLCDYEKRKITNMIYYTIIHFMLIFVMVYHLHLIKKLLILFMKLKNQYY